MSPSNPRQPHPRQPHPRQPHYTRQRFAPDFEAGETFPPETRAELIGASLALALALALILFLAPIAFAPIAFR